MPISRRSLLTHTAVGVGGLAIGTGGGLLVSPNPIDPDPQGPALEAAQAADEGERPARIGNHRLIWNFDTNKPYAAITFDDGPDPRYTPKILQALADAGDIKATFNMMGYNVVEHASLAKEVLAAGHEIGNHTWNHKDLSFLTEPQTRDEIFRCKEEAGAVLGQGFTSFRPPRGEITGSAMKYCAQLGYDVYIWSCTRGPGGPGNAKDVAAYMGAVVEPGDVLGLHDSTGRGIFSPKATFAVELDERRDVEVAALPEALKRVADRGIQLTSANRLKDLVL